MRPSALTVAGWILCLFLLELHVVCANGVDIQLLRMKPMQNNLQVSAYPNPFDQFTMLTYRPEETGFVRVVIHSSQGKLVGELYDDLMEGGSVYQFQLAGEELESGVYWCSIETNKKVVKQRLEIIR